MRTLRTLSGVALVLAGFGALGLAIAGWTVQQHTGPSGAFTAPVSAVRTDGYAVTVPDLSRLLDQHVVANALNVDRVRITVESSSAPVVLWLLPADDVAAYLDGVALTELSGIGFSRGAQPVDLTWRPGATVPAALEQQSFRTRFPSGQSLEWDRTTDEGTSFLLMRADDQPVFSAVLSVAVFPTWLDEATWLSAFLGLSALTGAVALLFWRNQPEPALVLAPELAVEFAKLVADRLALDRYDDVPPRAYSEDFWPPLPPTPPPSTPASPLSTTEAGAMAATPGANPGGPMPARRDLTGELVGVPVAPSRPTESPYVYTAT